MAEAETKTVVQPHPADTNGDGKVSDKEHEMYMEFKRKELEDADAMRDAQRKMAWYSLYGIIPNRNSCRYSCRFRTRCKNTR